MFQAPSPTDALPPQKGIRHYFTLQRNRFANIGIDPTSLDRTIYNRFLTWVPMLCLLTLCGPMAIFSLNNKDDLNTMAHAAAPLWQSILSIFKFILFMWNKKRLVQLVRRIWFYNLKANDKELQIVNEENLYDYNFILFYYISSLIGAVLVFIAPLTIAGFYAWKGNNYFDALDVPLRGQYPLDPHKSYLAYGFNFLWNVLGVYYMLNGSMAIDALFSWFMRNISAQFRILNLRFTVAADQAKLCEVQGSYSDEKFSKSIIECVKYHRNVMDLTNQLNSVYGALIFVKFLISCLQLATLTFQLSQGGEIADQLFNVSFLIAVTTQLLLYCYGGQRIQDMSTSVESNIYESFHWHELSVKSKKMLLIIMMRAQKPCTLTGVFFVADLSLFVWVFRTAGSFMTMMISIDKKET